MEAGSFFSQGLLAKVKRMDATRSRFRTVLLVEDSDIDTDDESPWGTVSRSEAAGQVS